MSKKKSILRIVAVLTVLVVIGLVIFFKFFSGNTVQAEVVESLVATQTEKEQQFKTEGFTIDGPDIIVNPYGNSPLTALVLFETEEAVSPKVTIHGKDSHSTFTHTFEENKQHLLPIYGLYPGKENKVTIEFGSVKKDLIIKTDELPERAVLPTKVKANKKKLANDLYFFTPSSKSVTCAYDVNGDIRWYLTDKASWKIDRLENGHLLLSTERLINDPYYTTGLYEMDLLGKIYKEYSLPGGYHHDYYEMKNGNLLVASDDFNSDAGTVEDVIVEVDRETGNIVKTFDLKDILNQKDGKAEDWTDYDWFHNNSVWYDEETNSITLSGRHKDAVINIDYESGDLNWIIGDPTNWDEEYQKYFFKPVGKGDFEWQWSQHAAMITPENYVFILDNGNNKSKIKEKYVPAKKSYTRGVMYKIDTEKMTIEQVWQYGKERGSEFYSPYISDVDYLAANHYIVHSGGISYTDGKVNNIPAGLAKADKLVSDTVEVLKDKVIFEIVLPTNNYRVEKMSLYTDKDTSLKIGEASRLGSLGITKVDETRRSFVKPTTAIDADYEARDISLKQEVDRLEFRGRFKRGDKVKVKLKQGFYTKVYEVRVSKKPYTALCVDIFTEEEKQEGIVVTKYINADELTGKHSVYVEINGKVYNTGKYVQF